MTGRLVSLSVIAALIVFLAIMFFHVVAPFLLSLFLAGITAVVCQPLYRWFMTRLPRNERLAAGLTTGTLVGFFLIPAALAVFVMTAQLASAVKGFVEDDLITQGVSKVQKELHIDRVVERLEPLLGSRVDEQRLRQEIKNTAENASDWLANQTVGLAGKAIGILGGMVSSIVQIAMFVIALYYFLADGSGLLVSAEKLIPLETRYQQDLIKKFNDTIRAVVTGTFFAAVVQGVLCAILLYCFGYHHAFLIFFLATFCSLIPLLGTALVWGPVALWTAANGDIVPAIAMASIGGLVIGSADNIVRAYILGRDAKLHPLLAFVCVLGGIQVMGLWGIFIGPVLASILHALIVIFNTELAELSRERIEETQDEPATPIRQENVIDETRTDVVADSADKPTKEAN